MSWYKVTISAHQATLYEHGKIQDMFLDVFMSLSGPKDLALFSGSFNMSDTFNIYFTPACDSHPAMKALMDSCGAIPCEEPTREAEREMGLLVGYSEKWKDYMWFQV